jgi:hypothetical protein
VFFTSLVFVQMPVAKMPSRLQVAITLPSPVAVPPIVESVTLDSRMPVPEFDTRMPVIEMPETDVAWIALPEKLANAISRTRLPTAPAVRASPFVTLGLPESTTLVDVPRKITGRLIVSVCVSVMLAPTRIS